MTELKTKTKYDVNEYLEFLAEEERKELEQEHKHAELKGTDKMEVTLIEEDIPNETASKFLRWAIKRREEKLEKLQNKKGGKKS